MRYLKRFNERRANYPPISQSEKNITNMKSKIDEISYILRDVNIMVYVQNIRLTPGPWTNAIALRISLHNMDTTSANGDIQLPTTSFEGYFNWISELRFNDVYLEFVDRVMEICEKYKYEIFIEKIYPADLATNVYSFGYRLDGMVIAENSNGTKPPEKSRWVKIEDALNNSPTDFISKIKNSIKKFIKR